MPAQGAVDPAPDPALRAGHRAGGRRNDQLRMPAYRQGGMLVYFAAFKHHIGLYPPVRGDARLEKAVARYAGVKGNLRFPLDEPIPYDLIRRIMKLRLKQATAKAAAEGRR